MSFLTKMNLSLSQFACQILSKLQICSGLNTGLHNPAVELSNLPMCQDIHRTCEQNVLYSGMLYYNDGEIPRQWERRL